MKMNDAMKIMGLCDNYEDGITPPSKAMSGDLRRVTCQRGFAFSGR